MQEHLLKLNRGEQSYSTSENTLQCHSFLRSTYGQEYLNPSPNPYSYYLQIRLFFIHLCLYWVLNYKQDTTLIKVNWSHVVCRQPALSRQLLIPANLSTQRSWPTAPRIEDDQFREFDSREMTENEETERERSAAKVYKEILRCFWC